MSNMMQQTIDALQYVTEAPRIEYPVFFNLTPHGPKFVAYVSENGKFFPIYFTGNTDGEALEKAKKWASENATTPERLARLAAIRVAKAERMKKARERTGSEQHD